MLIDVDCISIEHKYLFLSSYGAYIIQSIETVAPQNLSIYYDLYQMHKYLPIVRVIYGAVYYMVKKNSALETFLLLLQ